ncbi:hypothetical protein KKF84_07900, partial [Myxococcota bacterium]|nr:hypothetical protein [Myxococcota bacterium]
MRLITALLVLSVVVFLGCDDDSGSEPNPCEPNPCNGSHSLCANEEGEAVCRCPVGYHDSLGECCPVNSTFDGSYCVCDVGYSGQGDDCIATCQVGDDTVGAVAEPTLRATLPASWDENWYAS